MEQKLKGLFAFQRFQQNPRLKSVIEDVEGRYAHALDDDDLVFVNAAGDGSLLPREDPDILDPVAVEDLYPTDTREGSVILPPMTKYEGQ